MLGQYAMAPGSKEAGNYPGFFASWDSTLLVVAHNSRHCYVFIDLWPMHADSLPDKPPVQALLGRRIAQPRKPLKRGRDLSPVRKNEMHGRLVYRYIYGVRVNLYRQSAHATSPEKLIGAR
jgi:hypothetical protein